MMETLNPFFASNEKNGLKEALLKIKRIDNLVGSSDF